MRNSRALAATAAILLVNCGSGDNSSVRAFYPSVKPGLLLRDLIVGGEKAQAYDIIYLVSGLECPGDKVQVARHNYGPTIRITHPPPEPKRPWEESYQEAGFANREEFARGLDVMLPAFYSCKTFRFTFGRYQGWPNSDSFTVSIDSAGRVTSVSELTRDRSGD